MPHHPPVPKAPLPTREIFDPYNSTSTGHQHVAARLAGSTSWRDSRSHKLAHQFRDVSGRGGRQHLSDLVGAGSVDWQIDGRKENGDWANGAPGLREQGWQDIRGLMHVSRKRSSEEVDKDYVTEKKRRVNVANAGAKDGAFSAVDATEDAITSITKEASDVPRHDASSAAKQPPQIFRGLTIYLNGSTAPEVSDYKLKQLFAQHGGNSSIALGRRTVTHVILGKTCGGGLASGKIQREVKLVGGKGIKYVTAQWVIDSVDKGIRQPEGKYMPPIIARKIGGSGQSSVKSMFSVKTSPREACG